MTKKKAKSKTAAKKAAKKKSAPRGKKERNPAGVRNDLARIVESGAKKITKAVMEQAMSGQLAPARYLFEMASIYPASTDGSHASADEDCLAKTLLNRLNLPEEPIGRDEEDAPKVATSADKPAVRPSEDEEKDVGSEPEDGKEGKKPVLM
jgi:hypothetical protein